MENRGSCKWLSKLPGDGLGRRVFLAGALGRVLPAQKPETSGFDLSLLDEDTVPNELFFVREHFAIPAGLSDAGWKITVAGSVARALEFSYEELLSPELRKALPVTLECAENPVDGGLVSHAEWMGCPLHTLLEKAGMNTGGKFVRLSGADGFSRVLPLPKALHPDTLLAYNMNGEKLPVSHGFPVRALVPGWYGMDSVKWLRRIEVMERPDPARGYVRLERSLLAGIREGDPVREGKVKSVFSRPLDGAILSRRRFTIRGAAWAGEARVKQVELSVDGGTSWRPARLSSSPRPYAWVQWSFDWQIPKPGSYEWAVRATDEMGRVQPAVRASTRADDYEWNSYQRVQVEVT